MPNRKIIDELKILARHRSEITEAQRHYALVVEKTMTEICPVINPSEEVRFSHLRTLDKYIGKHALNMMFKNKGYN